MKYKLLLLDIDDTLTPNLGLPPCTYNPSKKIISTFKKAVDKIQISLCTGRDEDTVTMICSKLKLKSPQIIEGGAKIIDVNRKTLWVQYISQSSANEILKILRGIKSPFSVVVSGTELVSTIPTSHFDKITAVLLYDLTSKQVISIKRQLSTCTDLAFTVNQDRTGNTIYITHKLATKAHGVRKLMEILSVKREEIIGVGDGNNDKVMLLESGLKVGMGNAVQEIKEIANYLAPPVEKEGIVDVIEKFVLKV